MEVESKKIKLRDQEIYFRMNFRSLIEFEKIAGKPVSQAKNGSMIDNSILLYACAKSGMSYEKKPFDYDLDEFIDLIDDNVDMIMQIMNKDEEVVPDKEVKKNSKVTKK